MQQIILCKGLPASGKSTWAKKYCKDHSEFARINKDDVREFLGNLPYSKQLEVLVLELKHEIGNIFLKLGKSLIVDDTNFAKKHHQYWNEIALLGGFGLTVINFDTPFEECIKRDKEREKSVGEKVIMKMYYDFLDPKKLEKED